MVLADMRLMDPRAYVRPAAILRQQIAEGTLQPGGRTPSLTRLSQEHVHAPLTCSKSAAHAGRRRVADTDPWPWLSRKTQRRKVHWVEETTRSGAPPSLKCQPESDQGTSRAHYP